jgi:TolB-like protein/Tfp pilus assembly protein PilF
MTGDDDDISRWLQATRSNELAGDEAVSPGEGALGVGSQLSRFRIVERVGAGGMGVVYRAEDVRLQRQVALKVLPAEALPTAARRERFLREAQAASALNHPNIVTIHEVGHEGSVDYIVMEMLEGQSLRQALRAGPLPVGVAIELATAIADGLSAAHDEGIVHRDLKPENLFLTWEGRVKVLDFGLAKRVGHEPEEPASSPEGTVDTEPGAILGTVGYMSPEQAQGGAADRRSDVFSLGAVLYEMLTGQRAFKRSTALETMTAIVRDEPAPLSDHGAFPSGLQRVVRACLRKEPDQRFQSARDLVRALEALEPEAAVARAPWRPRRWLAATVLALAALGAAVAASRAFGPRERPAAPAPRRAPIRAIAVLPLQNLSGDEEQEYFADGMTDELSGALARVSALRVISRTSTMHYKRSTMSLRQIASELAVDAVVEGSVLRSGSRVRINARLSHAQSDASLWTQSYERDLGDVLALQRELAEAITQEIRVSLTQDERTRLSTATRVDPEAYQLYLQGRFHLGRRSEESLRKAIEHFQRALAVNPSYAEAYGGLADSYTALGSVHVGRPPRETRPLAEAAARKALELDGSLADAHVSLGWVELSGWNWAAAGAEFRRAIDLNPSNAVAYVGLAEYLISMGTTEEALAQARRAGEIDPLSPRALHVAAYVLLNGRRYDEAIAQFERVLELDPGYGQSRWFLGVAYAEKGLFDRAIAEHERALVTDRSGAVVGSLANVKARAGRHREARLLLRELQAASKRGYVTPAAFVLAYAGLGDRDRAFEWLERAAAEQTNLMRYLGVYPPLDPLRSDPRFPPLVRRVGLPDQG